MTTTVIYARISHDQLGTELGVQRQETECRELAARHGLIVDRLYVDNNISAYKQRKRPAWEELLAGIETGRIDTVIAWHPDRFTRHPTELENLVAMLDRTSTRVITVSAGEYDLSTATGRMCARVVGAVARHESEQKAERLAARFKQRAYSGAPNVGGQRTCGFELNSIDHHPVEADLLRWAAGQIIDGRTLAQVISLMPVDVYSCLRRPGKLRQMLLQPRIAGLATYHGEIVGAGNWEAIIPADQWQQLVTALGTQPKRKHTIDGVYVLSSVVHDTKGEPMRGGLGHRGTRSYRSHSTSSGPSVSVVAVPLETMVLAVLRSNAVWQRWPIVDQWDAMPLNAKRILLSDVFESITVSPAGGGGPFRPERITITLR